MRIVRVLLITGLNCLLKTYCGTECISVFWGVHVSYTDTCNWDFGISPFVSWFIKQ